MHNTHKYEPAAKRRSAAVRQPDGPSNEEPFCCAGVRLWQNVRHASINDRICARNETSRSGEALWLLGPTRMIRSGQSLLAMALQRLDRLCPASVSRLPQKSLFETINDLFDLAHNLLV